LRGGTGPLESKEATRTPLIAVVTRSPSRVISRVFHSPGFAGRAVALAKV
jgi:hypothetical protein